MKPRYRYNWKTGEIQIRHWRTIVHRKCNFLTQTRLATTTVAWWLPVRLKSPELIKKQGLLRDHLRREERGERLEGWLRWAGDGLCWMVGLGWVVFVAYSFWCSTSVSV